MCLGIYVNIQRDAHEQPPSLELLAATFRKSRAMNKGTSLKQVELQFTAKY